MSSQIAEQCRQVGAEPGIRGDQPAGRLARARIVVTVMAGVGRDERKGRQRVVRDVCREVGERALVRVTARLVSGQTLAGHIRYVSHDADPQTRTYHLEVTVPNPKLDVRSGLSAELHIGAGSGPEHLVPVSSLVLDSAGRQGVRYVLGDGRVAFAPITVMEETPQGLWVKGLNGPVQLIVVGQSYVADGQKVRVAQAR